MFASRVLWHPPLQKLGSVVAYVVGGHGVIIESTVGLLVLVAAVLWQTSSRPSPAAEVPAGRRARLERHRFAVIAALLFALYLGAPYSVNFGAFLYVRFLAPAFALAILLLAPPAGMRGALVVAPAIALLLAPMVAAVPQLGRRGAKTAAPSSR